MGKRWLGIGVATLALSTLLVGSAGGAPGGGRDPSFGRDGIATVDFGGGDNAMAIDVLGDGRIVAAGGNQDRDGDVRFAVTRLTSAGALDPTFGGDGRVLTEFGSNWAFPFALGAQPDGKTVVAGNFESQGDVSFALARYTVEGSLDPTFGGDGTVVTSFGLQASPSAALLVQPDGKLVAIGLAYAKRRPCCAPSDFALARYKHDGSLDSSFAGDGTTTTDFGESEMANAAALQADGKIVVAGWINEDPRVLKNERIALVRYLPTGDLDPTFDGDGRVVTDLPGGDEGAFGVVILPDGRILVAGGRAVLRYTPQGTLDPTFGPDRNGIAPDPVAFRIGLEPNGKIVTFGSTSEPPHFTIARLLPDGTIDRSFGTGGVVTTDLGGHDYPEALAIQPDGKIIAAGGTTNGELGVGDAAFVRYLPGTCSVPRLRKQTLVRARTLLARGNCRVGNVRRAFSKSVRKGRVSAQSPRAGEEAADWTEVDLTISRGRKPRRH